MLHDRFGFARQLGFQTVSATTVVDHFRAESEFIFVDNTPPAFRNAFEDRANCRRDPVMQHCKYRSVPIIWNQDTYTSAGQGDKWEMQARFGYRHGIALAMHLPEGRHFFIGVDRDQPMPASSAEVSRMTADLHLFAVHAQDAALRLLLPAPPQEKDLPRHQRTNGDPARQQRHAQVGQRQQASSGSEGPALEAHLVSPSRASAASLESSGCHVRGRVHAEQRVHVGPTGRHP